MIALKENSMIPYEGMEPFIYVSYSHRDSEKVHQIIDGMCNQGYRVWWDDGILAGASWTENITGHLSRCAVFMCCISHSSIESRYVSSELLLAQKENKSILPIFLEDVRLEDVRLNYRFHFFCRGFNTSDLTITITLTIL